MTATELVDLMHHGADRDDPLRNRVESANAATSTGAGRQLNIEAFRLELISSQSPRRAGFFRKDASQEDTLVVA